MLPGLQPLIEKLGPVSPAELELLETVANPWFSNPIKESELFLKKVERDLKLVLLACRASGNYGYADKLLALFGRGASHLTAPEMADIASTAMLQLLRKQPSEPGAFLARLTFCFGPERLDSLLGVS